MHAFWNDYCKVFQRQREREAAVPPRSDEEAEYREQKKAGQSAGGHPNIPVSGNREYVPARDHDEWTGERIRISDN